LGYSLGWLCKLVKINLCFCINKTRDVLNREHRLSLEVCELVNSHRLRESRVDDRRCRS